VTRVYMSLGPSSGGSAWALTTVRCSGIRDRVAVVVVQVGVGLEAIRLVAAYLRFQAEVPDFSGDVARRVVELLQVHQKPIPDSIT
jgi:hypothetical protein